MSIDDTNINTNSSFSDSNIKHFDTEEVWKIAQEYIRMYVAKPTFEGWFKGIVLEKIENGMAELSCDQAFKRETIEKNYINLVRNSLKQATGQNLEVIISVRSSLKNRPIQDTVYIGQEGTSIFSTEQEKIELEREQIARNAQLNPKYLFSNFIVGAHNRLAHAVGEAVVEDLGHVYNPVFIYGPTGVGKTHLMYAIGKEVLIRYPEKKVVYVSIEQFLNDLLDAIRSRTTNEFRNRSRAIDLLMIDDIQFVESYPKTQEELFHTFNTLYQANKQMVMAADRPPKELVNITDRLRSRFEGGMVTDIQAPDYETRMVILKQLAENSGVHLDSDVVELIARNIENSVRELEGAATKVITNMKFNPSISTNDIEKMLQIDIDTKRKRIQPESIISAVCEVFDVTKKEIKGSRRTAYIALSRQIVMYLLREELKYPLEKIAKEVNRKDHTTVLHACEKIEDMMKKNPKFKDKINRCLDQLA